MRGRESRPHGGREAAGQQRRDWNARRPPVNTGVLWPTSEEASVRVLEIQTKLHRWASDDPGRRFGDLYNLVHDPATVGVAWDRVRRNRGARTGGVDGQTARSIEARHTVTGFLEQLRADLKARTFQPLPVRERTIPKRSGKLRRLGIPTVRDRVVQAAMKVVSEPCLWGGLPAVFVWVPTQPPGTGRHRRHFTTTGAPALMSGCWKRTSRHVPDQTATTPLS